jgi:hypothetical protein
LTAPSYRVDRSGWAKGPWDNEPDSEFWREPDGLPCLIVRADMHGALCGYVGVGPTHAWYEKTLMNLIEMKAGYESTVHGGITFGGKIPIRALPALGYQDQESRRHSLKLWWVGFDCSHMMDFAPRLVAIDGNIVRAAGGKPFPMPGKTYRDIAYVRENVKVLAEVVRAVPPLVLH